MGTTSAQFASKQDFINSWNKDYQNSNGNFKYTILDQSIKSNIMWTVLRSECKETKFNKDYIICTIIRKQGTEFFWKDISHLEGPLYYNCPKKFINNYNVSFSNDHSIEWKNEVLKGSVKPSNKVSIGGTYAIKNSPLKGNIIIQNKIKNTYYGQHTETCAFYKINKKNIGNLVK